MATPGKVPGPGVNIPANPPSRRTVDMRSLAYGAAGPEQPYPVYQFSGYRNRYEWPGHNPFSGAVEDNP